MLRKDAFTAVEFIICLTFMMLIFGSMVSLTFKKAKQTMPTQKQVNMAICSCVPDRNIKCTCTGRNCTLEKIENVGGRHEFFTIQILGGGAAGSTQRGGQSGEGKIIHYPALDGEFHVQLGEGGKFGTSNVNGGTTAIYKINKNDKGTEAYELLEFALGGVGSNELIHSGDIRADQASEPAAYEEELRNIQRGKAPAFASGESLSSCGAGGDARAYVPLAGETIDLNGKDGEVIIKW